MNFFCSSAEFDHYVADNELDPDLVIKCDAEGAVKAAYDIFSVED